VTGWGDTDDVGERFISDADGETVLAGRPTGTDAATDRLATVFHSLRQAGHEDELAGTDALVSRMAVAARNSVPAAAAGTRHGLRRLLTAKAAALAAVGLVGLGAAAAATGTLPGPVEDGLAKIGIDVDDDGTDTTTTTTTTTTTASSTTTATDPPSAFGADAPATPPPSGETPPPADSTSPTTTAVPVGPSLDGPAKVGLCTAFRAHGRTGMTSTAFANLLDAATEAGQTVEQFCAEVTGPGNSGSTPAGTAPGKPDDPGRPDDPGHSGSTPAGTAPGKPDKPDKPDDQGPPAEPGNRGSTPAGTAPGQGGTDGGAKPEDG